MNEAIWRRVFELAEKGRFGTSPNPRVGAVLVSPDGKVVGEGFHEKAGGPHAEVVALSAAGELSRGSTLHINLEPCAHHGRTPPCVEALIAAGVARVVCSMEDPDPRTAGAGLRRLREAGMDVEVGTGAKDARRLNEAFLLSAVERRPFVHLKWAASLDGKIASVSGASRWITGGESREDAMRLREECDAILVGAETVCLDDPLLTRRLGLNRSIIPHRRLVLDGRGRSDARARVFGGGTETWLVTAVDAGDPVLAPFRERGVEVVSLAGPAGVDLGALLARLHRLEVRSLLVEGGGQTAWSFLSAGLADRVTAYVAPSLIGGSGASPISGSGFSDVNRAPRLAELEIERLGADLKISGQVVR